MEKNLLYIYSLWWLPTIAKDALRTKSRAIISMISISQWKTWKELEGSICEPISVELCFTTDIRKQWSQLMLNLAWNFKCFQYNQTSHPEPSALSPFALITEYECNTVNCVFYCNAISMLKTGFAVYCLSSLLQHCHCITVRPPNFQQLHPHPGFTQASETKIQIFKDFQGPFKAFSRKQSSIQCSNCLI